MRRLGRPGLGSEGTGSHRAQVDGKQSDIQLL
jgi:hypothetical protein